MVKITITQRIRACWLTLFCPGFWEFFPKTNEAGPWVAVSIKEIWTGARTEMEIKLVKGDLVEAYLVSRRLAFELDGKLPGRHYGIHFGIRRPTPGEIFKA